jgi:hypothetical protein
LTLTFCTPRSASWPSSPAGRPCAVRRPARSLLSVDNRGESTDWVGQVQYSWLDGTADTLDSPKEASTLVKATRYFLHTRGRPDRAIIQEEWIVRATQHPLREDGETVHNAFFDRDFEE